MSTISVTNIADGDAVTAASINNQVNTIVNDYNGNITDANVSASAAIGAQKIAGGVSGMFGAWTAYTPTFTNFTIGNGTVTARYAQIGKTVHYRGEVLAGTTSSMGAGPLISMPVTSSTTAYTNSAGNQVSILGQGGFFKTGTGIYYVNYHWNASTTMTMYAIAASGTYGAYATVTSTVPDTLPSGSYFSWNITYEAA